MHDLSIQPISNRFTATITPPGSKSLTNRALVLASLSDGESRISNLLLADDTRVMIDALRKLGFEIELDEANKSARINGRGGTILESSAELSCENSGTTMRFLSAMCALGRGIFTLDGVERMRQRPIGPLVEMLKNLGVRIEFVGETGFPPLRIEAHGLPGGMVRAPASVSSQYLSAMLMISPYARQEVVIDLEPNQTSWPYVAMTMRMMDEFGVTPELVRDPKTGQPTQIIVPQHRYRATSYEIEPDASNASYFLALAAIHPGSKITVEGLGKASLQGDVGFADVLHRMGATMVFGRDFVTISGTEDLEGIEVDLSAMPDTAQTLAVVALFAHGQTVIRGLHTLRVKETDRIAALKTELTKLGASVAIEDDESLVIDPPSTPQGASIATYDDHRMAMSFAIAGTRVAGVTIENPDCVSKTYPEFFNDLQRVVQQEQK